MVCPWMAGMTLPPMNQNGDTHVRQGHSRPRPRRRFAVVRRQRVRGPEALARRDGVLPDRLSRQPDRHQRRRQLIAPTRFPIAAAGLRARPAVCALLTLIFVDRGPAVFARYDPEEPRMPAPSAMRTSSERLAASILVITLARY